MKTFAQRYSKSLAFAVVMFAVFSAPAVLLKSSRKTIQVSVSYPREARSLASVKSGSAAVPQQSCQLNQQWRYRCEPDKSNCVKDRKVTFLDCKKL